MMDHVLTRRRLIQAAGGAVATPALLHAGAVELLPALLRTSDRAAASEARPAVPSHLKDFAEQYRQNPRQAAVDWFRTAHFGLFMHYGLYSLIGHGEWVMLKEKIPVAEYSRLKDRFTAEKFDADFITDLARDAGMRYVNLTARHHDSFSLFRTKQSDYNSVDSPAKRDLVGELADACRRKGLALFLYYSYALDWYHPYFFPRSKECAVARPAYDEPDPAYLFKSDADFQRYLDFVHGQLRELLTQYGPIAGIWLDPLMGYYCRPDLFPIAETYALIRSLQPGCLVSFKQGVSGDEDFVAPERKAAALTRAGQAGMDVWEKNRGKPIEICNTLQPREWGHDERAEGEHKNADEVMGIITDAAKMGANLLLNTGPLGDGSIHQDDVATLREIGRRLRKMPTTRAQGSVPWPTTTTSEDGTTDEH